MAASDIVPPARKPLASEGCPQMVSSGNCIEADVTVPLSRDLQWAFQASSVPNIVRTSPTSVDSPERGGSKLNSTSGNGGSG